MSGDSGAVAANRVPFGKDWVAEAGGQMEKISKTDLMLLGMLMRQPMHGYELVDQLGGPYMSVWVKMGRASVYYALNRLDRAGYVSRHSERHGGKPERTVYSITDEGRREFYSEVEVALGELPVSMENFDIALFYANQLEPTIADNRMRARLTSLQQALSLLEKTLEDARADGDTPLTLVLDRRRALLDAEIQYVTALLKTSSGGTLAAVPNGASESSYTGPLYEVLRNLAAARRSGILWAFAGDRRVGFQFDNGRLGGLVKVPKTATDDGLRDAFSATERRFAFSHLRAQETEVEPVDGQMMVILRGCRLVPPEEADRQLPVDTEAVLDTRPGYEYETVGVDLTEKERRVLAEIDGVRTFRDLARQLSCDSHELRATLYPLWATGWIVRSDERKRRLVGAVATYLRLFGEAASVIAGRETITMIYKDVSFAAAEGSLPDFWHPNDRRSVASRFVGDQETVEDQSRAYVSLVLKSARSRLGEAFVSEILGGVAERISDEDSATLTELDIPAAPAGARKEGTRDRS